ncbi:MAG TPA: bifunctional diaminohydroxyphosphoribosylaminopyrimidine deaminase/5-amino-6-(5-phosphoribosylamino)uracil reductase RibD, partial [Porphyromonadaceae bacterium]|nr:bifunctional diaminohydroxyphosphoribosylaminopyrimidine deaminase/5-amino-6-(5-phosphoribosylamino)uracil reductase RibD [Porphyromonadaceae bacterium]
MQIEEKYMRRCITLARNGAGFVSPNPMVGAVVVCDNKIIGEGYHAKCGEAHAEVNAIASVRDKELLKRSTIYVSLEPCSHHGKTPPCAELIIKMQIPRVVVGSKDPFPQVAGRGIAMLRAAGIDVVEGVLKNECDELNKTFMHCHTANRPFVLLKWAQTADGYMDYKRTSEDKKKPLILSNEESRRVVHKLRSQVDAIMVGTTTALLDNPSLSVRYWSGRNPVRIVLDQNLELPKDLHLFDGSITTLVINELKNDKEGTGLEYIRMDFSSNLLSQILSELQRRKIESLMVEGGCILLQSFIDEQLWDEARVEYAPF